MSRDFTADRPNRLWVTDLTYVPTWAGMAYVCFIVDAFCRRIVGLAGRRPNMRTEMVLDALEMARLVPRRAASSAWWPTPTPGRSSPSVRFTERLAEIGARPSIGTVGD